VRVLKFEDSVAPFNWVKKNGYYKVGNKFFSHKTFALVEASKTKHSPIWEFNSDVFGRYNWQQQINESLTELYKSRALQLREKYDYLLVTFSGGADSSNVIDSFILNNIHIDEIIIHWPKSLTDGKYTVSSDRSKFNILSEWQLAAKPKLDHIQKFYPNIKITFSDLDDLGEEYNEELFRIASDTLDFPNIKRQRSIHKRSCELLNAGFNVATIYGFDKPCLYTIDQSLYAGFLDQRAHVVSDLYKDLSRNIEYFYWSPDLPKLAIKQAQILYEYFKSNPESLKLLPQREIINGMIKPKYIPSDFDFEVARTITSKLLYPSWDLNTFQADKPTDFIKCEHHEWIRVHASNERFLESHKVALQHQFNLIDDYYFKNRNKLSSYGVYTSGKYILGNI
jgi:hypothetical protein